jgi:uncharacterized damage-inducible protein DinB
MCTPITKSFGFSNYVMQLATGDLKGADAMRRLRPDGGPSIAWAIGHMCYYRVRVLALLGHERPNPFEGKFSSEAASDGHDYPPIADLKRQWDELHGDLERALADVGDEQLQAAVDPDAHDGKKLLDSIVFFTWHEAYHMGQIGSLRTHMGYPAVSQVAAQQVGNQTTE